MYANANPIANTDPTGNFSLGDLQTSMRIDNILEDARNHNYIQLLAGIKDSLKFIRLSSSYINMFTCAILGDTEGFLLNMANVYISAADILNICEMATVTQMLTKALAVYDIFDRMDNISEGLENGETMKVIWNITMVAMDVSVITATCFTGDTLVAVEGGQKRMDELEAGDYVWAYDVGTRELELKEVLTVYVKENDEILHLRTTAGDIDTTMNHPFYVTEKGWVAAGDLEVYDEPLTIDGSASYVLSFELEKLDAPIAVYNIEVDEFHTYFAGNGMLVHNRYSNTKGTGKIYSDYAKNATQNPASSEVVLGKYNQDGISYVKVAENRNATYFQLDNWDDVVASVGENNIWNINEQFLQQQMLQAKTFILSHNPYQATGYYAQEISFLQSNGYSFIQDGTIWKAIK